MYIYIQYPIHIPDQAIRTNHSLEFNHFFIIHSSPSIHALPPEAKGRICRPTLPLEALQLRCEGGQVPGVHVRRTPSTVPKPSLP